MDIKSNIHILDFIENGNHIIKQADVLLISSQNFESFGLTAVEAMLNHVPVVNQCRWFARSLRTF